VVIYVTAAFGGCHPFWAQGLGLLQSRKAHRSSNSHSTSDVSPRHLFASPLDLDPSRLVSHESSTLPFQVCTSRQLRAFSVALAGRTLPRRHTSVERKLGDLGLGRVGSLCIVFDGLYHRELSSTWLLSTLGCGADEEPSLGVDSQSIPCKREFGQSHRRASVPSIGKISPGNSEA
jgi:hypothetical protein